LLPSAERFDEQVQRVAVAAAASIREQSSDLLHATGKVILTIFDPVGAARIELTTSRKVLETRGESRNVSQRLAAEIDQLAEDIRRCLLNQAHLVAAARKVDIEIHLRGPRPDIELIYRTRRT
jgi:hypothetical protein